MENDTKKKEQIKNAAAATDSMVRELQETVDALPRTDHMTLPAVMITIIDEETLSRMKAVAEVNAAKKPKDTIKETGKTLEQVRNEFEFGVTELTDTAGKHTFKAEDNGVTVIPPPITVVNAKGEEEEVQGEGVTIQPTPANIAPVDADAPHNPVEEKEAKGLSPDTPSAPTAEFGTLPKVGGETPATRPFPAKGSEENK